MLKVLKVSAVLAAVVCLGGIASVTAGHRHHGGCGGWGGGYSGCGYGGGYSGGCGSYSGYGGGCGYGGWNSCGYGGSNFCGYGGGYSGGCGSYGYSGGCAGGACGLPSGGHAWNSGDGYVRSTVITTTPTVATQRVTPTALQVSTTAPAPASQLKWY